VIEDKKRIKRIEDEVNIGSNGLYFRTFVMLFVLNQARLESIAL